MTSWRFHNITGDVDPMALQKFDFKMQNISGTRKIISH